MARRRGVRVSTLRFAGAGVDVELRAAGGVTRDQFAALDGDVEHVRLAREGGVRRRRFARVIAGVLAPLRHCGVAADLTRINEMIVAANEPSGAIERHRTSASARESIGRWRSDLSPATQERCNALFADSLKFFGYHAA